MKNKVTRVIAFLTALTLMVTCLASCAKKEKEEKVSKPDHIEKPETTVEDIWNSDEGNTPLEGPSEVTTEGVTESTTQSNLDFTIPDLGGSSTGSDDLSFDEMPTVDGVGGMDMGGMGSSSSASKPGGLTAEDIVKMVNIAGFEYDAEQQIFYSKMNPLQRHFGFSPVYDESANSFNMFYKTMKIDFEYDDMLWRIQCWKGQYGILAGAEMGVYLKDPNSPDDGFYECADDEHLMPMKFKFYKTVNDFNNGKMAFQRQDNHWWLTGFKFGQAHPIYCVLDMTFKAYDSEMADAIVKGLEEVKDYEGYKNGFTEYSKRGKWDTDVYKRDGNIIRVIWVNAGMDNFTNKKDK